MAAQLKPPNQEERTGVRRKINSETAHWTADVQIHLKHSNFLFYLPALIVHENLPPRHRFMIHAFTLSADI